MAVQRAALPEFAEVGGQFVQTGKRLVFNTQLQYFTLLKSVTEKGLSSCHEASLKCVKF